jgi:hypothetical protein
MALALLAGGTGRARADLITVTVGGASAAAAADTVTLSPNTVTLNVTEGIPLTADIQPGIFHVGDSGTLDQTFPFTLSRPVTINGVTLPVSQPGQFAITPALDTLTLFDGPTTTFLLGAQAVEFTPRGLVRSSTVLGDFPITEQGTFLLTPVPEPSTSALFGLGIVGLLGYAWRQRRGVKESGGGRLRITTIS